MMNDARPGDSKTQKTADERLSLRLTPAALEDAVRRADPAAFLLLPRILRRVIKQDRRLSGFGFNVPHRESYVIDREPLLAIVEKSELGVEDEYELPPTVILLAWPRSNEFSDTPADYFLHRCWRLLFHARVHLAFEAKAAAGELGPGAIRQRIHDVGMVAFDEVRLVLEQEDLRLPPVTEASTYIEFVATYLELRYFAPSSLPRYFPGLTDLAAVDAIIGRDVDAAALFEAGRPIGAPDPVDFCELNQWAVNPAAAETAEAEALAPTEIPSEMKYRLLMRKAKRSAELGNVIRSAICHAKAERCVPPKFVNNVWTALKTDVGELGDRLQAVFELDATAPRQWRDSLLALVRQTPRGIWTVEARLLYDLQKACVAQERDIFTVDLVEWALWFGRRPVKRQLPNQRDVLLLKHLRSAVRRLLAARISDDQRRRLAVVIMAAIVRIEVRLREQLRSKILEAFDKTGFCPRNMPERVARKKITEEMLDRIAARGFLSMGDLRDAISRNNLRLPDVAGVRDFLRGDLLLRVDRQLAVSLDGVYHRGEFYLRWMQRLSSLAFGTRPGRFVTRTVAVPFGGAYVALAGTFHLLVTLFSYFGGMSEEAAKAKFDYLVNPYLVLSLGVFLLCVVNSTSFRRVAGRVFQNIFYLLRLITIEPIRWLFQSPWLQAVFHSRAFTIPFRYLLKPMFWTAMLWWLLPSGGWRSSPSWTPSVFVLVCLLLNSRFGRNLEELIADEAVQSWRQFGVRAVTGLFWFIVDVFKGVVEAVERLMYAVDEWLRFKSGGSRRTLALKAALGVAWFFVAYVLRFAVNVLIEPQINPIKHFPVVTVSHKLLIPTIPHFTGVLETLGLEKVLAGLTATLISISIPGIFGFLVWELKENWRLYAANRRRQLGPVMIGAHGENMGRLLRPGFHSGTLPKRFAKLRYAERTARLDGDWRPVHKHLQALHLVELSVRRYVEREFLELFAESAAWQASPPQLGRIRLGANFVRLSIQCPEIAEGTLHLTLETQAGWLLADADGGDWVGRLPPWQRQMLVTAIIGLYKTAGIDLIFQQMEGEFPPPPPWLDVSAQGLIVWPDPQHEVEAFYDLTEPQWIAPQGIHGLPPRRLPTVERERFVFSEVEVDWNRWVEVWGQEAAGQGHPREPIVPVRVLPTT
jgi:hypothetical protein